MSLYLPAPAATGAQWLAAGTLQAAAMLSAAEEGLGSVGPHTSRGQSKMVRASSPEAMQRAGPSLTQAGNAPPSQLHSLVWHLGDPGNAKSKCGRSILARKKKRKKGHIIN